MLAWGPVLGRRGVRSSCRTSCSLLSVLWDPGVGRGALKKGGALSCVWSGSRRVGVTPCSAGSSLA